MLLNRKWKAVVVGATLALTATACGGSSDTSSGSSSQNGDTSDAVTGGTLNMLGAGDVDYMDPNVSYYSVGYTALRLWSRQLFTYPAEPGKTTTAAPDLATEIPTTDNGGITDGGKTYTIHLRAGSQWDTTPVRAVTAQDEVRGVKRTCNPVQPFGGIPDFASLIVGYQSYCDGFAKVAQNPKAIAAYINSTDLPGVVAKNDQTVVFKLTHPATYFVDMLTLPAFSPAPVEVLKYLPGSQDLGQHEISDGPYKIDSWSPTKSIMFSRNSAWQSSSDPIRHAYVDKVDINETVSQNSIQQQLQTGSDNADMEFDQAPPPSQLPALIAKKDPNLNLGDTFSTNPYVVFNTVSPNNGKAMENVQVRQALEYALNRDHLIQVLGGPNINKALTHVLPPGIVGSQDSDMYGYDIDKAKQMLSQAGADGITLKLLYRNASEGSRKSFETIQQDLSKVGIKVTGIASPDADFYTKYLQVPSAARSGVWDMAIAGWGPDWYGNSALSFFAPLFSGQPSYPPIGSNFGFYDDPTTNRLIEQATTASTEDQASALWAKADQQVMKEAAFFPITSPLQANYHASQVHNAVYIPAFQNYDPANVWLESGHQGG